MGNPAKGLELIGVNSGWRRLVDLVQGYRWAATYVDRILRGEKPSHGPTAGLAGSFDEAKAAFRRSVGGRPGGTSAPGEAILAGTGRSGSASHRLVG